MSELKCTSCGFDLLPGDKFCPGCGFPVEQVINTQEEKYTEQSDFAGTDNTVTGSYVEASDQTNDNQTTNFVPSAISDTDSETEVEAEAQPETEDTPLYSSGQNYYEQLGYDTTPASDEQPSYEQPTNSQPSYEQPTYSQPGYEQPTYNQSGYEQPTYSQPSYEQPTYNQQSYGQQNYGQQSYNNGQQNFYEQPMYQQAPTYQQQPAYDQTQYYGKKKFNKNTPGRIIASFFLCTFVVILMTFCTTGLLLRSIVSERSVKKMLKDVDYSDIVVSFSNSADQDVPEYVAELITDFTGDGVSEKDVEKVLGNSNVTKFLNDTIQDYAAAILDGDGKATIKRDRLEGVIVDVLDDLGVDSSSYTVENITDTLYDDFNLDNADLTEYIDEDYETLFNFIKTAFSYTTLYIVAGVALLLMIILVIINHSAIAPGVITLIFGLYTLGIGILSIIGKNLISVIVDDKSISSLISLVLSSGTFMALVMGGSLFVAGLLAIIISAILHKKK